MTDLILVSGKGGVGKSAVAAAYALRAQREGKRALAIAMVGADGLASHLSISRLNYSPTEVRPGLFASMVERSKALTEYLQVQLGVPALAAFGPAARAFDALASAAPAVREVVTIGKVLWEVRRERWDLVIADGPPTGQVGSFLRAARTVAELVPAGRIRDQASWMDSLLADPSRTRIVLVTVLEELPINETKETLVWLKDEGFQAEVLANRVLPPLAVTLERLPAGPAGEAALLHLALYEEQQRWLAELPVNGRLPYLFGLLTPAEVAAHLSELVL